jgi:hypothetical protein
VVPTTMVAPIVVVRPCNNCRPSEASGEEPPDQTWHAAVYVLNEIRDLCGNRHWAAKKMDPWR